MTEILLSLISLSILGYHAFYVYQSNKEKKQLVDAIISKSASELRDLRVAENTKINVSPQPLPQMSEFIPTEQLDDEALLKAQGYE